MAITKLINENENNIKDAISSGISAEAVGSTIEDVINKSDKPLKQLKEVVEVITEIKEKEKSKYDPSYASKIVKENSDRIKSAINNGLTSNEIASTLIKESNENTKKGKKHLKFIVNLISKMKKKELKLNMNKQREKGRQKVYSNNN